MTERPPYAPIDADPIDDAFARRFAARYLEAWNAHDAGALLALAAPDVLWEDPTIRGGVARGQDEVRVWLASFWRSFPDMAFEFLDAAGPDAPDAWFRSSGGRRLAAPWRCRGTNLGPLDPPGIGPTGRRVELVGVDLYSFRGDRLAHVRTIVDGADAARQLGLLPRADGWLVRTAALAQRLGRPFRRLGRRSFLG